MTDPISQLGRSSGQLNISADKDKPKKVESEVQQKNVIPQKDEVILSHAAKSSLAKAEFDEAKVAQIKSAIQEGNYPINSKKVAESFRLNRIRVSRSFLTAAFLKQAKKTGHLWKILISLKRFQKLTT